MAGPGVYYFFPTDYFVPPLYSTTPNHKDLHAPITKTQIRNPEKTADDRDQADHDGDQRLRMKESRKLVMKVCTESGRVVPMQKKQELQGHNGQCMHQKSRDCDCEEGSDEAEKELALPLLLSYPVFASSIPHNVL